MALHRRRDELLATYQRPYVRWLPKVYRGYRLDVGAGATALLGIGGGIGELAGWDGASGALALATAAGTLTVAGVAWATAHGVAMIREHTAEWRPGTGDLALARARRPHRADAHPVVAHDEYAVAVSERGTLVTFSFTPLAAREHASPETVLITGVPRYEAREVAGKPFEIADAATAAEQLLAAQEHAARLEAAAVERALAELELDGEAQALLDERRTTQAALRRLTGQDD